MFLLDELLYYSRDDNQFLRRRRTFFLVLCPDLVETRFKDFELPYQRGVMLTGLLYVIVRRIKEWLGTDALRFEVISLGESEADPLAGEKQILEKLFFEEIALDEMHFTRESQTKLQKVCEEAARKSMVHCLMVGVQPPFCDAKDVVTTRLAINGPRPSLGDGMGELNLVEGDDASDSWAHTLQGILQRWV
jgi:hypothetical protein